MDTRYEIEILKFEKLSGNKYYLVFQIEQTEFKYNVNIIDNNGIFGIEIPDELGLSLREKFPMSPKEIVGSVRTVYEKLSAEKELQVA